MTSRFAVVFSLLVAISAAANASPPAGNIGPVPCIGIGLDNETQAADKKLCEELTEFTKVSGVTLSHTPEGYGKAINDVVEAKQAGGFYVARLTPFAYVAAELRGAELEILGTYLSKATSKYTYHAYFVVNAPKVYTVLHGGPAQTKASIEQWRSAVEKWNPTITDVSEFLRRDRRKFVFHDKFSTSSYFIPSIFFHDNKILQTVTGEKTGAVDPLDVDPLPAKSDAAAAVRRVEGRESDGRPLDPANVADIAAVWDKTVKAFPRQSSPDLRFVMLDPVLPNDLLVCSRNLPEPSKEQVRNAVRAMKSRCDSGALVFGGDYVCWSLWTLIDAVPEARKALATLRRLAIPRQVPVTVQILAPAADAEAKALYAPLVDAAEHAVRFAGTELTIYDPDFHSTQADVVWKLELIHKGALKLTSSMTGFKYSKLVKPQEFEISFTDTDEDLPRRIEWHIHNRMNRIRYVWPFETKELTVLRDVNFSVPKAAAAVQKVVWSNPDRDEYAVPDPTIEVMVHHVDLRKIVLENPNFPRRKDDNTDFDLDPLSNVAYRIVLVRPDPERRLFHFLTLALVLLFVMGAVAVVIETRRHGGAHDKEEARIGGAGVPATPGVAPALSGPGE